MRFQKKSGSFFNQLHECFCKSTFVLPCQNKQGNLGISKKIRKILRKIQNSLRHFFTQKSPLDHSREMMRMKKFRSGSNKPVTHPAGLQNLSPCFFPIK